MARPSLSPAEAAFLIEPRASSASRCLQAALLTLLGHGHIAFGAKTSIFAERRLRLSPGDGAALADHVAVVRAALADYRPGTAELSRGQVVHALQKKFGLGYGRYVRDHVAPALIGSGLITAERRKFLGLVPFTRYARTTRGAALAAPLLRLMRAADDLPAMIEADPDRALHLVRSAGVLLVMSPTARRQIPKLRKLFDARGDDSPALSFAYVSDEPEAEWEQILEIGDIVLSDEALDLFDSIDAVADFTASDGSSDGGDGGDGGGGGD